MSKPSEDRPVAFCKEIRHSVEDDGGNKHTVGTGRYRLTARCPDPDHGGEATVSLVGAVTTGVAMYCAHHNKTFIAALPKETPDADKEKLRIWASPQ